MSDSEMSIPQNAVLNSMELQTLSNTETNVSQNWASVQCETFFNHEKTVRLLDQYVKTELFHMIVFISSPALIAFSRDAQSLCQVVCNYLNIAEKVHECIWMIYARLVEQKLNHKRSDVSNAMKAMFKGKQHVFT